MTNTQSLEHWTIDMINNTQHTVHIAKLEKRVIDLEKRIEELERAFYEKVDHPGIDRTEVWPIRLAAEYQQDNT